MNDKLIKVMAVSSLQFLKVGSVIEVMQEDSIIPVVSFKICSISSQKLVSEFIRIFFTEAFIIVTDGIL